MPTEGYTGRQRNGYVLAAIVAAHAAALTAVMLARMDVIKIPAMRPLQTWNVPIDPLPPEVPPPPTRKQIEQRPQARSVVTTVPSVVPIPIEGPIVNPPPTEPILAYPATGSITILPPTLLPRIEPSPPPRAAPVKLKPRGNPAGWVTTADYPDSALRAEEQGRTSFALDVSADGRPTACKVTASSGSAILDQAACRLLLRRASFTPGKDADGNPAGGTYANSFRWQIPED